MSAAASAGSFPVQERSLKRVQDILDATARIVEQDGLEAVNPTAIAYLSGSSVPSVYRYFPNTRSILRALAKRNLDRFLALVEEGSERATDTPWSSLDNTLRVFVQMFREEPGFRALRFGDRLAPDFLTGDEPNMVVIAKALAAMFADTHRVAMTDEMLHHIEVATTSFSALVELAFLKNPAGDKALLDRATAIILEYLPQHVPLADR